jgi:hypothetical protein
MILPRYFLMVLMAAILAGPLAAQDDRVPGACFHPHPSDRCAWFPLIETGISARLTEHASDTRLLLDWRLGLMKNTGPRTAMGAAAFASAEGDFRVGAVVRARRWLSPSTSLDLSAGLNLAGAGRYQSIASPSPTFEARLASNDYLAATARVDLIHLRQDCVDAGCSSFGDRTSTRVYLGVGTGSTGGLITFAATGVLFVIALIAVNHSGYLD